MSEGAITCPNCGFQFEISDALTAQIRLHLEAELRDELATRESELKGELKKLAAEREALSEAKGNFDAELEKQLVERRVDIEKEAHTKAEVKFAGELAELKGTLDERDASIKELQTLELGLRKERRELEAEKERADLEMARALDAERASIRKSAEEHLAEEHRLKDLEKDQVIDDLKTSLDEMKRRVEQGSVERQGEVLELDFETRLLAAFPHDSIKPVPKGIRGADLMQTVRSPSGTECGEIIWEIKNTKKWGNEWIPKLKDDMISTGSFVAIIVSVTLPENVARFDSVDGVWVSDPVSAVPLAGALRNSLIALETERESSIGKNEKMELLYRYLSGTQFRQKIEGIVDAFTSMQEQIQRERRAMEKQWKEREKQIERVVKNTSGLYGDMQGIIGGQIPEISALELDSGNGPVLSEESSRDD